MVQNLLFNMENVNSTELSSKLNFLNELNFVVTNEEEDEIYLKNIAKMKWRLSVEFYTFIVENFL